MWYARNDSSGGGDEEIDSLEAIGLGRRDPGRQMEQLGRGKDLAGVTTVVTPTRNLRRAMSSRLMQQRRA